MKNKFTYRSALLCTFLAGLVTALAVSSAFSFQPSAFADGGPAPIVVNTPSAPHPQARVRVIDLASGVITFDWLDANGQPVDTGNSQARITVTGDSITPEQKAILAAIGVPPANP